MLRQAAGQEVDPRLFWSLPVHLLGVHVELLRHTSQQVAVFSQHKLPLTLPHTAIKRSRGGADLREVGDVSLAEGHVVGLLHDVGVNDQHVGELRGEAQLDLSAAVEVETHALGEFWNEEKNALIDANLTDSTK